MGIRIVGLIKDTNNITTGYRLYNESKDSVMNEHLEQAHSLFSKLGCVNAKMENGKLVGTECSIDRLTVFDQSGKVTSNRGMQVLARLTRGSETMGYKIIGCHGECSSILKREDIGVYVSNPSEACNVALVDKDTPNPYFRGIKKELPVLDYTTFREMTIKREKEMKYEKLQETKKNQPKILNEVTEITKLSKLQQLGILLAQDYGFVVAKKEVILKNKDGKELKVADKYNYFRVTKLKTGTLLIHVTTYEGDSKEDIFIKPGYDFFYYRKVYSETSKIADMKHEKSNGYMSDFDLV